MNRTLQSSLAIAGVLTVGLGLWYGVVAIEVAPPPAPPRHVGPVPVDTAVVEPRELVLSIDTFGNLESRRRVTLSSEVAGRIEFVHAGWRPGAIVEAGEVLVRLQSRLFELDVEAAEAAVAEADAAIESAEVDGRRAERALASARELLAVAKREHERLVELGGVASDSARDAALRAKLDAERAEDVASGAVETAAAARRTAEAMRASRAVTLARAKENLARAEVRAPFRGRLRGQAPGIGTVAGPGIALGELIDPSDVVLTAHVPERDLLILRVGMPARLTFPSNPETDDGAVYSATVVAVDATSDPRTRRGIVELALDDARVLAGPSRSGGTEPSDGTNGGVEAFVPAGLFAAATIEVERIERAKWIDRRHFVWEDGVPVAYVLGSATSGGESAVAARRPLTLLREHGEGFLVGDGFEFGDRLIVAPLDRVSDGVQVRTLEADER